MLVNDFEIYLVTGAEDTCKVGFVTKEHCSEAELLDSKLSGSLRYTPNMMWTLAGILFAIRNMDMSRPHCF